MATVSGCCCSRPGFMGTRPAGRKGWNAPPPPPAHSSTCDDVFSWPCCRLTDAGWWHHFMVAVACRRTPFFSITCVFAQPFFAPAADLARRPTLSTHGQITFICRCLAVAYRKQSIVWASAAEHFSCHFLACDNTDTPAIETAHAHAPWIGRRSTVGDFNLPQTHFE